MNSDINKYKLMATGYMIKRELMRLQRLNLKCVRVRILCGTPKQVYLGKLSKNTHLLRV